MTERQGLLFPGSFRGCVMWVTVCFSANIKINHPEVIKWHSLSGVCLVLTEPDMLFP